MVVETAGEVRNEALGFHLTIFLIGSHLRSGVVRASRFMPLICKNRAGEESHVVSPVNMEC